MVWLPKLEVFRMREEGLWQRSLCVVVVVDNQESAMIWRVIAKHRYGAHIVPVLMSQGSVAPASVAQGFHTPARIKTQIYSPQAIHSCVNLVRTETPVRGMEMKAVYNYVLVQHD